MHVMQGVYSLQIKGKKKALVRRILPLQIELAISTIISLDCKLSLTNRDQIHSPSVMKRLRNLPPNNKEKVEEQQSQYARWIVIQTILKSSFKLISIVINWSPYNQKKVVLVQMKKLIQMTLSSNLIKSLVWTELLNLLRSSLVQGHRIMRGRSLQKCLIT